MDFSPQSDDVSITGSSHSGGKTPEGCQVCSATTNIRKNFGVPTCVSCRIFYSRNLIKDLKCYQNGQCKIEGPSRKSCAFCRFQKCLRAGMHKTHERRHRIYKRQHFFKPSHSMTQQKLQAMHSDFSMSSSENSNHFAPADYMKQEIVQEPSFDVSTLFQECFNLSDLFRQPFTPIGTTVIQTSVPSTNTALSILEAVMKRVLSVVRRLPHFNEIGKDVVSSMISEKICGLTAIMNSLNYCNEQDRLCLNLVTEGSPHAQMTQPLAKLTESIFDGLINGEQKVMTEMELISLIKSTRRFYCFCSDTFKELRSVGVLLLAGIYFFTPDYKFTNVDAGQLRIWQQTYLHGLRMLLKTSICKPEDFLNYYTEVMLQFTEIKVVEFYHNLLARNVTIDSNNTILI